MRNFRYTFAPVLVALLLGGCAQFPTAQPERSAPPAASSTSAAPPAVAPSATPGPVFIPPPAATPPSALPPVLVPPPAASVPIPLPAAPSVATPPEAAAAGIVLEPGLYRCDLNRQVVVRRVATDGQSVVLQWNKRDYTLTAVLSRAGALRYDDIVSGLAWITIPGKSMLLDTKKGSQLAQDCRL